MLCRRRTTQDPSLSHINEDTEFRTELITCFPPTNTVRPTLSCSLRLYLSHIF